MTTIFEILDEFRARSSTTAELGTRFEKLMASYLLTDPLYAERFSDVWLWLDWPDRQGPDTGIDLVAKERDGEGYCAIQCKFYEPEHVLRKEDLDSFFTASGKFPFTSRIIISTTDHWGKNAEDALSGQQIPVSRIRVGDLNESAIDWSQFSYSAPEVLVLKPGRHLRPHQTRALDDVLAGFEDRDRGKLIMACGTGKTFTALKIAERIANDQAGSARVLFLVPSISLLSQSLREWTAECELPLVCFAVCSDPKVSKRSESEDISTHDLALPATTDPVRLVEQFSRASTHEGLSVIFSTYQSIAVISEAQQHGLPEFDLIVCDEAHRTTGVTISGDDESAFVRVHDPGFLSSRRRLYMTATPRLYDDETKRSAQEHSAVLCSMDDEALFGPEFHRLGFGQAVAAGLLTDYKVLILTVAEKYVAKAFQAQLANENNELNLDDAVKIIGCWNGLAKRSDQEDGDGGFLPGEPPMRRAVAFSRTIRESKKLTDSFTAVLGEFEGTEDDSLRCDVHHVDGTFNALRRNAELDWLKAEPDEGECRILSNAKCLSEGIDVPSLDAVLFLNPRNSVVDVVQSVGRVMRKSEGKEYGYIILPVGIPSGIAPETALADNKRYKVIWQVLQALRAHDDRFNATVNKIELNKQKPDNIMVGTIGFDDSGASERVNEKAIQQVFDVPVEEWRDAIYAKIVTKVGERAYWESWARDVSEIAARHTERIKALLDNEQLDVHAAFERFLEGLRRTLNDGITEDDAVDMLSQHLITRPVFEALFEDYSFAEHNPVSIAMQQMIDALAAYQLGTETERLEEFYRSVRLRAEGIDNAAGKQRVIIELYEKFFRLAFPKTAARLGIVYTPVEIVDFIINSVQVALRDEFGTSLSDSGVHVLDPFTGTGTFIVRLLQSGLIKPGDLSYKYANELHANEIVLLAYYIAAINIEAAYHDLAGSEYVPFGGVVLADSFQIYEQDDSMDDLIFPENNERILQQKRADIRVILSNPPYSVGQGSENDANKNLRYPSLDQEIRDTYAARSNAGLKRNLYDSYIRAFRLASDRIGDRGVVCFVSNGSFIDSGSADGFRKALCDEFSSIYCFNLRGNARTSGEQRQKERGNVFGEGSRTPVAVTLLVKNPDATTGCKLRYHDIGDYLTREQKLDAVRGLASIANVPWQEITPDDNGDWINLRDAEFDSFQPLGDKRNIESGATFDVYSQGVLTARDAWAYNFSRSGLLSTMGRMIDFYNGQVDKFLEGIAEGRWASSDHEVERFIDADTTNISWTHNLKEDLRKGKPAALDDARAVPSMYRPFCKQWLYFDRQLNERVYQLPKIFPTPEHDNLVIATTGGGAGRGFSALIIDTVPNYHLEDTGQSFPLYYYEKQEGDGDSRMFEIGSGGGAYERKSGITDQALATYRSRYGPEVERTDIFYYLYGIMHSPEYKERFAADLTKTIPRIPLVEAFWDFSNAGRDLASLHLGYESVDPFPVTISEPFDPGPEQLRVEQMRFGAGKDRSRIVFNSYVTLQDIPAEAYEYEVNGKSAIEWIMDRYKVTVDKASGIRNDPNEWSDDPRYVLDLARRIITVSMESTRIVKGLPQLSVLV